MDDLILNINTILSNLQVKMMGWLNDFIFILPNFILAIGIAIAAYLSVQFIKNVVRKFFGRFSKNDTVLNLSVNLSTMIFGIFTLFLILSVLNLEGTINKILATAGVLGLAVGLALQNPMNNLFSGVFMSVRKLYRIGDLVETNGYFGTIQDIDLKATKLRLPTGQIIVIPNKDVLEKPITNYTVSGERRIDLPCGVSYGDHLEKVKEIAINAIQQMDGLLQEKPVDLIYTDFGDSSVNFTLRFWIDTMGQKDYLAMRSMAIKALKKAFDENDVMIPFPIRTIDFGIRGGLSIQDVISSNRRTMSNATPNWNNQN